MIHIFSCIFNYLHFWCTIQHYHPMKNKLPSVFNNMTASYKAYWFIGLLECVNEEGMCEISIRDLCARMLVNAWYPVHFFRLNFGMFDRISAHNKLIKEHLGLEDDISKADLLARLLANKDGQVEQWIMHFKRNVTYRFLSPWIRYSSDAQVARDSLLYLNDAPYAIDAKRNSIRINLREDRLAINT